MIYNMRIYDLKPGAVPEYMEAVRKLALKIREDHGIKLAGWYYTDIGPQNRVVHIWAYEDYAHYERPVRPFTMTRVGKVNTFPWCEASL